MVTVSEAYELFLILAFGRTTPSVIRKMYGTPGLAALHMPTNGIALCLLKISDMLYKKYL